MIDMTLWQLWWHEAVLWRVLMAVIAGGVVAVAYFKSLRWSINRLNGTKKRAVQFAGVAFARIALFFGVLILVAHKNMVLLLVYLGMFFITKMVIIWIEKHRFLQDDGGGGHAES
jgi:hypothetical protein